MVFDRLFHCAPFVIAAILMPLTAQDSPTGSSGSGLPEETVRQEIVLALNAGLPPDSMDRIAVLAMQHSPIAAPLLVTHIQNSRADTAASKEEIKRAADVLAYIGDDRAVDAVIHLIEFDPPRFGYLAGRVLDYAWGRRNPYVVAY